MRPRAFSLLFLCGAAGCYDLPCPAPSATLGPARDLSWGGGPLGTVPVTFRGDPFSALLDTGFRRTAFAPSEGGTELRIGELTLGAAKVSPIDPGALLGGGFGAVVGTDALQTLPFVVDPSRRTTTIAAGFDEEGVSLQSVGGHCDDTGAEGPSWVIAAAFGGSTRNLLLDTGAELTVVRQEALPASPRLTGVRIATGFAGIFTATASRLPSLASAGEESRNVVVLAAPELDRALDTLVPEAGALGGLLGFSFLREHRVELDGMDPSGGRTLKLTKHGAPLPRHFVGIGVNLSEVAEGLRVDGFLGTSPGRDAGLLQGDVILTVARRPAKEVTQPWAAPNARVALTVLRGGAQLDLDVEVRDLLPDP